MQRKYTIGYGAGILLLGLFHYLSSYALTVTGAIYLFKADYINKTYRSMTLGYTVCFIPYLSAAT